MSGIINIPESLYVLESLLGDRIDLISGDLSNDIIDLFEIVYFGSFSVDFLKNIVMTNLVKENYYDFEKKYCNNGELLSKVKKLVRDK